MFSITTSDLSGQSKVFRFGRKWPTTTGQRDDCEVNCVGAISVGSPAPVAGVHIFREINVMVHFLKLVGVLVATGSF